MKRILIFGDSIMRGVYYSEEAGRHKLFRERFEKLRESGCELVNSSVMGATVSTGSELLRKKLSAESGSASDATVIFEYGGNDCDYRWADISENPEGDYSPNTPMEKFISLYGENIEYAKKTGARVMLCNLVPLDSDKYLRWISRNLSYENIMSWLGDKSMLYRWQEYYNRTTEALCEKYGTPLIDIRSPFLLSHKYGSYISPDGIHPTVEGHRLIDELITAAV